MAYVTSWSSVIPDPEYVTHINYAFGHVNGTFNGVRIDNEARWQFNKYDDVNPITIHALMENTC